MGRTAPAKDDSSDGGWRNPERGAPPDDLVGLLTVPWLSTARAARALLGYSGPARPSPFPIRLSLAAGSGLPTPRPLRPYPGSGATDAQYNFDVPLGETCSTPPNRRGLTNRHNRVPTARPLARSRVPARCRRRKPARSPRSEEHTSELQSRLHLVCRLLLEKKKNDK